MSPMYPSHYENSRTCFFDIEAPLGKAITLNFTDFDLEDDCDFDSLSIYDGVDSNSTRIGEYCGQSVPPTAISTLNHMHLEFKSDSSISGRGFKGNYSFIDASKRCSGFIFYLNKFTTIFSHFFRMWRRYKECRTYYFTANW